MGQQQLLLVILGAILVAFAIAIGLTLFSAQAIQANKTAIFNDINQIAAYANHFRVTTTSMGGGQGSFAGFKIPVTMTSTENAGFRSVSTATTVTITASSMLDSSNTITVTLDQYGKLANWTYTGDFQ
ncbi:MAG: hypothetical protein MUE68_11880 [Bacteroidetes bacterium]|jgi:hypothetical protein|nr:hypothetical protein [Bacteroidota bacterium]